MMMMMNDDDYNLHGIYYLFSRLLLTQVQVQLR